MNRNIFAPERLFGFTLSQELLKDYELLYVAESFCTDPAYPVCKTPPFYYCYKSAACSCKTDFNISKKKCPLLLLGSLIIILLSKYCGKIRGICDVINWTRQIASQLFKVIHDEVKKL